MIPIITPIRRFHGLTELCYLKHGQCNSYQKELESFGTKTLVQYDIFQEKRL